MAVDKEELYERLTDENNNSPSEATEGKVWFGFFFSIDNFESFSSLFSFQPFLQIIYNDYCMSKKS